MATPRKSQSTSKNPKSPNSPMSAQPTGQTYPVASADNARPFFNQVAERAYFIWERKGHPLGQDEQNWLEAEAELSKKPRPR